MVSANVSEDSESKRRLLKKRKNRKIQNRDVKRVLDASFHCTC